jgi:8-oxo-dGTP diphosphatase
MHKAKVTLLFLRQDDRILLAMKKRGFGVGKWNGVGGKVDADETYEHAAVRECEEEIGVTPKNIRFCGELHFLDLPHVDHYCFVYETYDWDGEPHETEEMRPQWFNNNDIPYEQMWVDDKYWIPKLLVGTPFRGKVVVEDDELKECTIEDVTTSDVI